MNPQSDRRNPGIKRTYYPLPVETPEGLRCVQIHIPDGDEYVELLRTVLQSLALWFNYDRDETHRGKVVADLWRDTLLLPDLEGCMNCEELQACLQPLFDALQAKIDDLSEQVEELEESVTRGGATVQPPQPQPVPDCDPGRAYAGCVAVVESINDYIIDIFEAAEAQPANDHNEEMARIIGAIPVFETLPIDDLFAVVDWMFENQMEDYEGAYTNEWRDEAACQLWCLVNQDCELTHDHLSEWLWSIESKFPGNEAAEIFQRFGRATGNGLLQQVGQFINDQRGGQSITEWFDSLMVDFGIGAQLTNPGYSACDACECSTIYKRPENVPPNFDVSVGIIGVENVLAVSADSGGLEYVIADFDISFTNAFQFSYVTDIQTHGGGQFYTSAGVLVQISNDGVNIGPGLWEIRSEVVTPFAGTFDIMNMVNGVPFKLLQIRVYEEC